MATLRYAVMVELIEAEWRLYASINKPSLVQIMACRLVGAEPLSESVLKYFLLNPQEQISVQFNQNSYIFIPENAIENVVCNFVSASMC